MTLAAHAAVFSHRGVLVTTTGPPPVPAVLSSCERLLEQLCAHAVSNVLRVRPTVALLLLPRMVVDRGSLSSHACHTLLSLWLCAALTVREGTFPSRRWWRRQWNAVHGWRQARRCLLFSLTGAITHTDVQPKQVACIADKRCTPQDTQPRQNTLPHFGPTTTTWCQPRPLPGGQPQPPNTAWVTLTHGLGSSCR